MSEETKEQEVEEEATSPETQEAETQETEQEAPKAPAKKPASLATLSKGNGSESIKFISLSSIEIDKEYNVRDFDPSSSDKDMECHTKTLNRLALVEEGLLDSKKVIEHALYIEMKDPEGNKLSAPRLAQGHRRFGSISLVADSGEYEELIGEDPLVPVLEVVFESEAERQFDLIESNKHAELSMSQAGEVFQRLKDLGYSAEEIAERSGYKQAHVYNCLKFFNMPAAIKRFAEKGVITPTMAIDITRNAKKMAKAAKIEEGLKGKQAIPTDKEVAKVEVEIVKDAIINAQLRVEGTGLDKKYAKVIRADAAPDKAPAKKDKAPAKKDAPAPSGIDKKVVTQEEWDALSSSVSSIFEGDPEMQAFLMEHIGKAVELDD